VALLLILALAGALIVAVLFPLLGKPAPLAGGPGAEDLKRSTSYAVRELHTDLQLDMIANEDLRHIESALRGESAAPSEPESVPE